MSILSGPEILRLAREPDDAVPRIRVNPLDPALVNPNSIDVRLGDRFRVYEVTDGVTVLDPRSENKGYEIYAGGEGLVLRPNRLYLGHTAEAVGGFGVVPLLETKSSIARLGVSVHLSAGFGDDGFFAQWTLEITCVHPVRLYPGMRIAQIAFHTLRGDRLPYRGRYQGQTGPVASRYHEGTPK